MTGVAGSDDADDRPADGDRGTSVISRQLRDQRGRVVSLREIGDDWRAVADVAPRDGQRAFVFGLAARYVLLSIMEGEWRSLGIYADDEVAGHVMWAVDDDGAHWIGGLIIHGPEQGFGLGRAATRTLVSWLRSLPDCRVIRLSYHPDNTPADALYSSLGFVPTGTMEDDEVVVEYRPPDAGHDAG